MKEGQAKWFISLFGTEKEMEQLRGFLDLPNCRLVTGNDKQGMLSDFLSFFKPNRLQKSMRIR